MTPPHENPGHSHAATPGKSSDMALSMCSPAQCDTHYLRLAQMKALYNVSQVLSHSLDYRETIAEVLRILDEDAGLGHGLVSVIEPDGSLLVQLVHGVEAEQFESVRYQPGEGIIGYVLEKDRALISSRVGDDRRFLNKLGVYDPNLPIIALPIKASGSLKGVFVVQPETEDDPLLDDRARFMEMIANLVGQSLRLSLQVELDKRSVLEERDLLRRAVRHQHGFDSVVGRSAAMRRIFEQVRLVSKWNTTVLIRGETGTGKELIANAIHYNSPRARGPLVKLNCAALPETLLESELFGHERGSFTGATGSRKGRFEQADGGTLFLDEIGEISPAFQAKLLRVLQEGEFERVGGSRSIKVDVRIITATHRDLEAAVDRGNFREDLFYRLNVMPLYLPPLRDRPEDIPEISRHLLSKIGNEQKRKLTINDAALRNLAHYEWPGNVRELENCLERAAILSESGVIDVSLIRFPQRERVALRPNKPERPPADMAEGNRHNPEPAAAEDAEPSERGRIISALEQAGWVQAKAARLLNMTPRQIAYRIQTLNIELKQI
ncbi:sigma-54-dependent Fis family transcriptional regulator [Betaproteobacteria bacterium]|nr:sigma-54-dependent Fis family transcriptional regulator [Betaproteobacteria bacterium]GHU45591.1 sigma-54-dependent Fis family transcriptional regulator [Betaproteobacteria bacterium]